MKSRIKGFTLVELLTVIGIISLLVGILVPALHIARLRAREATDRATLNSISMAVETFRNDHGFYPPSHVRNEVIWGLTMPTTLDIAWQQGLDPPDQGAHRLFEALMGLDTLGFQENYCYKINEGNTTEVLDGTPIAYNSAGQWVETKRWGPYIGMDNIEMGRMYEAHYDSLRFKPPDPSGNLQSNNNWVFLDTIGLNNPRAILYYRARPSRKLHWYSNWKYNGDQFTVDDYDNLAIYNYKDNIEITTDTGSSGFYHPNFADPTDPQGFYNYIWDPMTGLDPANNNQPNILHPSARPYNKDSFILINAGRDNQYGTEDDICNFQIRKN